MWLLTSPWSNPMKHLIPYLQDDQKAADYLRQLRWPDGVTCPRCGSDRLEPRERCDNGLDGGIYETYHLDSTRQLEHQVEADECYQSAGSKGLAREVARRDRAPRPRGMQLRGRATAETGRPPILGLVQRHDKRDQD